MLLSLPAFGSPWLISLPLSSRYPNPLVTSSSPYSHYPILTPAHLRTHHPAHQPPVRPVLSDAACSAKARSHPGGGRPLRVRVREGQGGLPTPSPMWELPASKLLRPGLCEGPQEWQEGVGRAEFEPCPSAWRSDFLLWSLYYPPRNEGFASKAGSGPLLAVTFFGQNPDNSWRDASTGLNPGARQARPPLLSHDFQTLSCIHILKRSQRTEK